MRDRATAEGFIASMFADPAIEFTHTRNVSAGCYMFRVSRPGAAPSFAEF